MTDFPAPRGPSIHALGRFRRHTGLRTELHRAGAPSTTSKARILNTAIVGSPGTAHGILRGADQMSGAAVFHDAFVAYTDHVITSPNEVTVGAIGAGKSGTAKIGLIRQLMLRNRRAVVLDKKPRGEDGDGEYSETSREMSAEPFLMWPGHPDGTCLNPLDPIVLMGDNRAAALGLLTAVAELCGQGPLNEVEHACLTSAHRTLLTDFEDARRVPVVEDLIGKMPGVVDAPEFKRREATQDVVDLASLRVEVRLRRLLADDLTGMFDGPTSRGVELHPKLTTFNISNLPENGPAVGLAMAVVNAWLMGMLRRTRDGRQTTLLVEEAWHLLTGQAAVNLRDNAKLARALGLSLHAVLHHLSDVQGTDGMAMIQEAQTVNLFRQDRADDVAECERVFGLQPASADLLWSLRQGEHLLKIGNAREIQVRSVRSAREVRMTETDAAMTADR